MASDSHFTQQCSHIGIFGDSGSGKSTELESLMEIAYRKGNTKVIDLCDLSRLENVFKSLASEDEWMYERAIKTLRRFSKRRKKLRRLFQQVDSGKMKLRDAFPWEATAYPVECYIPAVADTPHSLPEIFKPFRIRFHELSLQEIKILLGKLSKDQGEVVEYVYDSLPATRTFTEFIERLKDIVVDSRVKVNKKTYEICDNKQGLSLLKKVDRLNQLGIIVDDKDDPLILDLDKIMKDTRTITCFSFFNIEDENIIFLFYGYLLRKIYSLRAKRLSGTWQYPEAVVGAREIHLLAPARAQLSSYAYEGQKISAENLRKIFREPRDVKLRIIGDSQDPGAIDPAVRGKFTTILIFRVSKVTLDKITDFVYVDQKTYRNIQNANAGIHAVRSIPKEGNWKDRSGFHYPCISLPPRALCKNPERLFFKIWAEKGKPFVDWKGQFKENETMIMFEKIKHEEKRNLLQDDLLNNDRAKLVMMALNNLKTRSVEKARHLLQDDVLKTMNWDLKQLMRVLEHMVAKGQISMEVNGKGYRIKALDQPIPQAPSGSSPILASSVL